MCKGLGLDLCAVEKMAPLLADGRFLERYFTPAEAAYVRARGAGAAQTLAGLYAAKEAVVKALGCGLTLPLREIDISHTPAGQPVVRLHGQAAEALRQGGGGGLLLTVTHEGGMAAAAALWHGGEEEAACGKP